MKDKSGIEIYVVLGILAVASIGVLYNIFKDTTREKELNHLKVKELTLGLTYLEKQRLYN